MEGVSVEDAGSYQCMIGKLEDREFIKDTRTISVEVATEADLQFGEDVDTSEEAVIMLKDQVTKEKLKSKGWNNDCFLLPQETTFSCSASGGKPRAEITAQLGEGEEAGDEDMELELDTEEGEDTEQTASFLITPAREDCGKFIRCSALQTGLQGEELFGGVKTISQKVM